MLGHPELVQADPREGTTSHLLLQMDSDDTAGMTWGDLGRLYYLIEPDALQTSRFDTVRCEYQSH